jgi:hypothetical protein
VGEFKPVAPSEADAFGLRLVDGLPSIESAESQPSALNHFVLFVPL